MSDPATALLIGRASGTAGRGLAPEFPTACPMNFRLLAPILLGEDPYRSKVRGEALLHERLSPLDSSFVRIESPNAHMHVAWAGIFEADPERPRPTLEALRAKVASRLRHLPRFRKRLAFPAFGLGEPFWVDDPYFDPRVHVSRLTMTRRPLSLARFRALTDAVLSKPLERDRPLWHIYLAPQLEDDRLGLVCKLHHALVDGKSAVEVALLLFDGAPDAELEPPVTRSPAQAPSSARLALEGALGDATESLRTVRRVARLAGSRDAGSLAGTLRRAALAAERDLLRPAPPSRVNVRITPKRTLVCHGALMSDVARARCETGATVNDVCLAAVAGALRELALMRGRAPEPLKVMVPVSVRAESQRQALGNRISFVFVDLPLDLRSPRARLERVQAATANFKASGRAVGTAHILNLIGALPGPVKARVARAAASARMYNLTVSSIPGPPSAVYMLGAELVEAYPVVPLAEDHALSIGIFGYQKHLFFGLHADPEAFAEVRALPAALDAAILALARARRSRPRTLARNGPAPTSDERGH